MEWTGKELFYIFFCKLQASRDSGAGENLPNTLGYKRHPKGNYACPSCPKVFPYIYFLRWHEPTHTLPIHCGLCPERVSRPGGLDSHMRNYHGKSGRKKSQTKRQEKICVVCQELIPSVTEHLQLNHPGVKPYKCTLYSYATFRERDRDVHKKIKYWLRLFPLQILEFHFQGIDWLDFPAGIFVGRSQTNSGVSMIWTNY